MMSELETVRTEFKCWLTVLDIALERHDKKLARDAIKEIETTISKVVYAYNIYEEEMITTR